MVDYDEESSGCFVTVKDTGEGMDSAIIETKLTRLFSSTKEDDFTKIGKFGIGFVSIFAIEPQLVVLETGKDGESWRVLFKPDRTFEKRALDHPVEGTSVTVFTKIPKRELKKLSKDCEKTIRFWCKHSDVEICFNGDGINEEFSLKNTGYQYRHIAPGTEAVVAPSYKELGFQGYYNRGLTLLEGPGSPFPHVSFKVRSRYLEHTLSRDNILQDENYERAMSQVKQAAFQAMPQDLFSKLVDTEEPSLWALASIIVSYEGVREQFIKRALFRTSERFVCFEELPNPLYFTDDLDETVKLAEELNETILLSSESHPKLKLLRSLGLRVEPLGSAFFRFELVDMTEKESELLKVLHEFRPGLSVAGLVDFSSEKPKSWKDRLGAYLNPSLGLRKVAQKKRLKGDELFLFRKSPLLRQLTKLREKQPELAVSILLRKLTLENNLTMGKEKKILQRLMKRVIAEETGS